MVELTGFMPEDPVWSAEFKDNLRTLMFGLVRLVMAVWPLQLKVHPRLKSNSKTEKMGLVMLVMLWKNLVNILLVLDLMINIFLDLRTR